jgi:hypothetical protein
VKHGIYIPNTRGEKRCRYREPSSSSSSSIFYVCAYMRVRMCVCRARYKRKGGWASCTSVRLSGDVGLWGRVGGVWLFLIMSGNCRVTYPLLLILHHHHHHLSSWFGCLSSFHYPILPISFPCPVIWGCPRVFVRMGMVSMVWFAFLVGYGLGGKLRAGLAGHRW